MTSTSIARRQDPWAELPLSPLQARWWELMATYADVSTPVVSLVHRLRGPLDEAAWLRAVDALVERHEALRTRIAVRAGSPVQLVSPPGGLVVDRVDLADLPEAQRPARARDLLNDHRNRVNDLEQGPLVRSCLIRLADDDHVWSLVTHHILADGVSLGIIDDELGPLYRAALTGEPPQLPAVAVQYGDYVLWQRSQRDPAVAEDVAYWRAKLAGVSPLELSADPGRRAKGSAGELRYDLDPAVSQGVEELARAQRCTRFMVLLAAFGVVLARESGQGDFCVGVAVRGGDRLRPELARTVGLFNNSVAIRGDLCGEPTFRAVLSATRDNVLDAFDHQWASIGQVITAVDPVPHPHRAQLFQVMFGMDETGAGGLDLPGIRVEPFGLPLPRTLHDLMLLVVPNAVGLTARFVHDAGIIDGVRVEAMARRYEAVLRAAVADPDTPLARLCD
jgi:hypothetical protein